LTLVVEKEIFKIDFLPLRRQKETLDIGFVVAVEERKNK